MNESGLFAIHDIIFNGNQDPDHNAIECPGYRPLTYRDLRQQIISVVKTLNAMGFRRNDRIAIIAPAGPDTAVIIISVMAGFTSIPLNPQNRDQEYTSYFSQLKIKLIIVQKGYETAATAVAKSLNIPIIELIPVSGLAGKFEMEPTFIQDAKEAEFATTSDIATLLLTSGTTAKPKIVPLSQRQFCEDAHKMRIKYQYTETDRHLHIVPYYHVTGFKGTLVTPLLTGGTIICTKDFIPPDFLSLLKTFRPTHYVAVPAMHQGILREIKKVPPDELKNNSLRGIRSGSASLPANVNQELEKLLGIPVTDGYAMSESGIISINIPPREGSVGIPVIEYLAIIDENGNELKSGETGEIIVQGGSVFCGYEDAPEENDAAFINGKFRTGDLGYVDDDGYLFITGRKNELINKGGRKISPEEIDVVLKSNPLVRDAMTFGVTDPVLGEDIAAMVVPADEKLTETDLHMFLLDRIIQFKVPRRIYFVDAIPRNPAGKPLRHVGTKKYS
jgi:acyl-CoA synthetase (AMP-forming)/AMP-acid ligase II